MYISTDTDRNGDATHDDITVDDDDVTVYFPGDENYDVDLDYLIQQLGFQDLNIG